MVFTLERAFKLDTRKGLSLSKHGELHNERREVQLHHSATQQCAYGVHLQ